MASGKVLTGIPTLVINAAGKTWTATSKGLVIGQIKQTTNQAEGQVTVNGRVHTSLAFDRNDWTTFVEFVESGSTVTTRTSYGSYAIYFIAL